VEDGYSKETLSYISSAFYHIIQGCFGEFPPDFLPVSLHLQYGLLSMKSLMVVVRNSVTLSESQEVICNILFF